MKSRAVRFTLFTLFLAAVGAAAYLFWIGESQAKAEAAAARACDAHAQTAARRVADLRAAQQGYVAAGQGEEFWASRADASAAAVRDELGWLRGNAISEQARTGIDSASSALQDFVQMDGRARAFARSGQKLLASDLVFSDGFAMTQALAAAIEQARLAETDAREVALRTLRRRQVYALGAAGAAATLILLLLLPAEGARREEAVAQLSPVPDPEPVAVRDDSVDFRLALDGPVEDWSPPRRVEPARPAVDIAGVASLCTELARVGDTRALPSALERAASVLEASGIVLWIADPDGRELAPVVAHGYAPQLVARLGTIARDAENATAAAFRTALLQTVTADGASQGAIAAPLLTPTGCVGVMAAEVGHGSEKQDDTLAAATIVAAQLATLVAPPARTAKTVEAAGA